MLRSLPIVLTAFIFCAAPLMAQSKKELAAREAQLLQTLENLRREVQTLQKIKAEKLDRIEDLETRRWEERYRQNQTITEHQETVRALDGKYSRASTDLGRLNDELVQTRGNTESLKEKAESSRKRIGDLNTQVLQAIEKASSELSTDFPVDLDARTLTLSRAQQAVASQSQTVKAISLYGEALNARYALTLEQVVGNRNSQIGTTAEVPVTRMRLGTVFLGESAREGAATQSLQRTGALQGRLFEWRDDLSESYSNALRQSIADAQNGNALVWIPLDVLQNKSAQATARKGQERTWKTEVIGFLKAGGPVMYPLGLVALMALLLSLERWIYFLRRGRNPKKLLKQLDTLLEEKRWEDARLLALAHNSSLGNALAAILSNVQSCSRTAAEKSLREVLLREQPLLERRMGMLGALGSSAPLLGLLGTVTGMISLFKVITDVGTNDAKVLAGGISEALVTTETGLIIAIPVLLLHGWLTERLDRVTSTLGIQSLTLLNRLWPEADQK